MNLQDCIQSWTLDWGSTADWVSGIATAAAVVFAVVGLQNERNKDRILNERIETEQAKRDYAEKSLQASKISIWHNDKLDQICIRNGSESLIYNVFAVMVNSRSESDLSSIDNQDFTRMLRTIPPGETIKIKSPEGAGGMGFSPSYDLTFRDSRGVTWSRSNWGKLVERENDVFSIYNLSHPHPFVQQNQFL